MVHKKFSGYFLRQSAPDAIFTGIKHIQGLPQMGFMNSTNMWNREMLNQFATERGVFSAIEETQKQLMANCFNVGVVVEATRQQLMADSINIGVAIEEMQKQLVVSSIDMGSAIENALKFHQTMISSINPHLYNVLLHQNQIGGDLQNIIYSHNISEQAGDILSELSNVSFEVLPDGSIAIDDDVVTISEMQFYLEQAISEGNDAIIQKINNLRTSDKVSARIKGICNILFTLLFFLFSPVLENLRDQHVPWTRAGITTEYKRQISSGYGDRSSLAGFRFVVAKKLDVRSKGQRNPG